MIFRAFFFILRNKRDSSGLDILMSMLEVNLTSITTGPVNPNRNEQVRRFVVKQLGLTIELDRLIQLLTVFC